MASYNRSTAFVGLTQYLIGKANEPGSGATLSRPCLVLELPSCPLAAGALLCARKYWDSYIKLFGVDPKRFKEMAKTWGLAVSFKHLAGATGPVSAVQISFPEHVWQRGDPVQGMDDEAVATRLEKIIDEDIDDEALDDGAVELIGGIGS